MAPEHRGVQHAYFMLNRTMAGIVLELQQHRQPALAKLARASTQQCMAMHDSSMHDSSMHGQRGSLSTSGDGGDGGVRTATVPDQRGGTMSLPRVGLGTGCAALSEERYDLQPELSHSAVDEAVVRVVKQALELGYRLFDTSDMCVCCCPPGHHTPALLGDMVRAVLVNRVAWRGVAVWGGQCTRL